MIFCNIRFDDKKMPINVDIFELREINRPSTIVDNINKEGGK